MKFSCSLCSGLFLFSRNLKKAVTFLRQKRRTTQHAVTTFFRKPQGFSTLWYFRVVGFRGCFAPCLGSLRCLIVSSCSPWVFGLCAQAQHTHSVRTHRQGFVFFSAFICLGPARVGQQTLLEGSFRSPLSVS